MVFFRNFEGIFEIQKQSAVGNAEVRTNLFEDDFYVKTNLWTIGNIAMLLMDLFYGVNKGLDVIKFIDNFIPRLKALEAQNHELKAKMTGSDRYRRIQQKISGENKALLETPRSYIL